VSFVGESHVKRSGAQRRTRRAAQDTAHKTRRAAQDTARLFFERKQEGGRQEGQATEFDLEQGLLKGQQRSNLRPCSPSHFSISERRFHVPI
jgi:hypothetical protein